MPFLPPNQQHQSTDVTSAFPENKRGTKSGTEANCVISCSVTAGVLDQLYCSAVIAQLPDTDSRVVRASVCHVIVSLSVSSVSDELLTLVHGQVTIIFVVSVCLSACLFVQSFSHPSLMRFRSN